MMKYFLVMLCLSSMLLFSCAKADVEKLRVDFVGFGSEVEDGSPMISHTTPVSFYFRAKNPVSYIDVYYRWGQDADIIGEWEFYGSYDTISQVDTLWFDIASAAGLGLYQFTLTGAQADGTESALESGSLSPIVLWDLGYSHLKVTRTSVRDWAHLRPTNRSPRYSSVKSLHEPNRQTYLTQK